MPKRKEDVPLTARLSTRQETMSGFLLKLGTTRPSISGCRVLLILILQRTRFLAGVRPRMRNRGNPFKAKSVSSNVPGLPFLCQVALRSFCKLRGPYRSNGPIMCFIKILYWPYCKTLQVNFHPRSQYATLGSKGIHLINWPISCILLGIKPPRFFIYLNQPYEPRLSPRASTQLWHHCPH